MKTENEGLESRIRTESRIGHHLIYGCLATFFGAGAVMAGIGAHNVEEAYRPWMAVMSGYTGMIAGIAIVWWYNDFWAYRKSKPL